MARDPRRGDAAHAQEREPGAAEAPRQRVFGEQAGDDGWTLIGSPDEVDVAAQPPEGESGAARRERLDSGGVNETAGDTERVLPQAAEPEPQIRQPSELASAAEAPAPLPAQQVPRPVPPRAAALERAQPARRSALLLLVAAAALLALGALSWRHASVVRALERDLAAERARLAAPRGPAPEDAGELARLGAEVERLQRQLGEVERRAADAEAAAASQDEARALAQALGAERDDLRQELALARASLGEAESRAQSNLARADALGAELERERGQPEPQPIGADERRAEVCERVLARVESGAGGEARALFAAGLAAGAFARGARDGAEFLDGLVAAAEELERARVERATSTSPAAAAVLAAQRRLAEARADLPAFAEQAGDWLARDARGGPAADPSARLVRVERALAGLEAEAARLGSDVDALHAADWDWIAARGPLQDPDLAQAHARAFACSHLAELARAAAERLGAECLADGAPLPERLAAAGNLPAWAALAAGLAPRDEAALELLWLDAARRWYAAGAPAEGFAWHGLEEPRVAARARDWRAELWLRVALAGADSAWPPRPGEIALYHMGGPSRARWRTDRCVAGGAGGGWTWLRAHFDERGEALGEPALVAVERDGERARLAEAELVLLDLRAPCGDCEVAPGPVGSLENPPSALGFDARAVLGRAAEATRGTCLIVRQGETTRWYSPRLGLVLEERELAGGAARVELALREEAP